MQLGTIIDYKRYERNACVRTKACNRRNGKENIMQDDLKKPARLQYWTSNRSAKPENSIEFNTLEDAIAFAMTQSPSNMEIAWIRTEGGATLLPSRISALWEMRRHAA
jgi:hypothetical protein